MMVWVPGRTIRRSAHLPPHRCPFAADAEAGQATSVSCRRRRRTVLRRSRRTGIAGTRCTLANPPLRRLRLPPGPRHVARLSRQTNHGLMSITTRTTRLRALNSARRCRRHARRISSARCSLPRRRHLQAPHDGDPRSNTGGNFHFRIFADTFSNDLATPRTRATEIIPWQSVRFPSTSISPHIGPLNIAILMLFVHTHSTQRTPHCMVSFIELFSL